MPKYKINSLIVSLIVLVLYNFIGTATLSYAMEPAYNSIISSSERRMHIRFCSTTMQNPIMVKSDNPKFEGLIDISRGGIAINHNGTLKEGDIIPVHIHYRDINIDSEVEIVSVTETRAGAKFIPKDKDLANEILYLSILLEADNNMLVTRLRS